jgi:phosphopantothenoylcysteine decarboxylase/phosphopantothenate--cysteine ligase
MRVIVGVTGGIAAYKATTLIRLLTEAGHTVKVIPTENALRFIGATTLEALSHNSVDPDLYTDVADVKHVQLGKEADLIIVAPATASFLARFAAGIADDLLGNTLLVSTSPILLAPAMHTEMWNNPATISNVATLRARGVSVLEPAVGRLTGEDTGAGRLPEPEQIVSAALSLLPPKALAGIKMVISAGGTQEPIDPVRFIGNRSSGKQGLALAAEAVNRGAEVTLIAANLGEVPTSIKKLIRVSTATELEAAVGAELMSTDVLIMAAAVSDYRVENVSATKIKKSESGAELTLKLIQNADILAGAVARVSSESLSCLTVGFAAETATSPDNLTRLAQQKLIAKGCDVIVANNVSDGAVFGSDENEVLILTKSGTATGRTGSKTATANQLMDVIEQQLSARS